MRAEKERRSIPGSAGFRLLDLLIVILQFLLVVRKVVLDFRDLTKVSISFVTALCFSGSY